MSDNDVGLLQDKVHPQTIAVLKSRADGLGLTVEVGDESKFEVDKDVSGVLVQYPATDGSVHDYKVGTPRPSILAIRFCRCAHLAHNQSSLELCHFNMVVSKKRKVYRRPWFCA